MTHKGLRVVKLQHNQSKIKVFPVGIFRRANRKTFIYLKVCYVEKMLCFLLFSQVAIDMANFVNFDKTVVLDMGLVCFQSKRLFFCLSLHNFMKINGNLIRSSTF